MIKLYRASLYASIALALALAPSSAHAQKPALVRNQDEPGRNPSMQSVSLNQSTQTCTSYLCTVYFNPVPAGFRLVITHVSTHYRLADQGTETYVQLGANGFYDSTQITLPASVYIGVNYYVASSPVTYFVEPGSTPLLFIAGNKMDISGSYSMDASISGYLVALP